MFPSYAPSSLLLLLLPPQSESVSPSSPITPRKSAKRSAVSAASFRRSESGNPLDASRTSRTFCVMRKRGATSEWCNQCVGVKGGARSAYHIGILVYWYTWYTGIQVGLSTRKLGRQRRDYTRGGRWGERRGERIRGLGGGAHVLFKPVHVHLCDVVNSE